VAHRPRVLATLEGYAVEGGFDRPHEPSTCYLPTIALGRQEGPGDGESLWRHYEQALDMVPRLGLDGVRLGVEWARIEPRQGVVDVGALDRYREVCAYVSALGLDVTIVLVGSSWPAWLGLEAWLLPWVVPHVVDHGRRVVSHLGEYVTGVVAFSAPENLVRAGYLEGTAPPWRTGARDDAASATGQVERITALLLADPLVGGRMVRSFEMVSVDGPPEVVASSMEKARDRDEIHVRALIRGRGPTSAPAGLLERRDGRWVVAASGPLLAALR
jgi:hypothetical protein